MNNKYDITKIKTKLENINAELNNDINELIKDIKIADSKKVMEIRNKNIETLLLIQSLEYKGLL
jgi:hypothetical protein